MKLKIIHENASQRLFAEDSRLMPLPTSILESSIQSLTLLFRQACLKEKKRKTTIVLDNQKFLFMNKLWHISLENLLGAIDHICTGGSLQSSLKRLGRGSLTSTSV